MLSLIALSLIPGLGSASLRRLLDIYPSADEVFSLSRDSLSELFGNRTAIIDAILSKSTHARAEAELRFAEQHSIRVLSFTDPDYPARLNQDETSDCPALLYVLGNADLNAERALAVVGTRKATALGRDVTARLVGGLATAAPVIVSGLALGIDSAAHTAALDAGLPTVAVLGHGLDMIYPASNRQLAARIVAAGGALATEFPSGTAISPGNFPARNRIIAALADATLVVEAKASGGALITAGIAASYQREVFAVPGRLSDPCSEGTNALIATRRASLVRSVDDIAYSMAWPQAGQEARQGELFPVLSPDEERVVDLLGKNVALSAAEVANLAGWPLTRTIGILFDLELRKVVRMTAGQRYEKVF